jgi:hypothetical protein
MVDAALAHIVGVRTDPAEPPDRRFLLDVLLGRWGEYFSGTDLDRDVIDANRLVPVAELVSALANALHGGLDEECAHCGAPISEELRDNRRRYCGAICAVAATREQQRQSRQVERARRESRAVA